MFGISTFSEIPYSATPSILFLGSASISATATVTASTFSIIFGDASVSGKATVTALGGLLKSATRFCYWNCYYYC